MSKRLLSNVLAIHKGTPVYRVRDYRFSAGFAKVYFDAYASGNVGRFVGPDLPEFLLRNEVMHDETLSITSSYYTVMHFKRLVYVDRFCSCNILFNHKMFSEIPPFSSLWEKGYFWSGSGNYVHIVQEGSGVRVRGAIL